MNRNYIKAIVFASSNRELRDVYIQPNNIMREVKQEAEEILEIIKDDGTEDKEQKLIEGELGN